MKLYTGNDAVYGIANVENNNNKVLYIHPLSNLNIIFI